MFGRFSSKNKKPQKPTTTNKTLNKANDRKTKLSNSQFTMLKEKAPDPS